MSYIYAMSDIHGEWELFQEMLELVDFSSPENKLVLLGDYIDAAHQDPSIYRKFMELERSHSGQVVGLMGNHEAIFLRDYGFAPAAESQCSFNDDLNSEESDSLVPFEYLLQTDDAFKPVVYDDQEVFKWVQNMPVYYETPTQIFVHAGIDEEAGEYWKYGVEPNYFYEKFPPVQGSFLKEIIAGHAGVHGEYLANSPSFHEVYWDGESHYYIDGSTPSSGVLPLLKYDTESGRYTSYRQHNGAWQEYPIEPSISTNSLQ